MIEHPLIETLKDLQQEEKDGRLRLAGTGSEVVDFYFQKGLIDAVATNRGEDYLEGLLKKAGLVPSATLRRLLRLAHKQQRPLCELALEKQALRPCDLSGLVRKHASHLLEHCLEEDFQVESFVESANGASGQFQIPLQALLLEIVRSDRSRSLRVPSGKQLVLGEEVRSRLNLLPWDPEEMALLGRLSRPRSLSELSSLTGLGREVLRKHLKTFSDLGLVEIQDGAEGSSKAPGDEFPEWLIPRHESCADDQKLEVVCNLHSFASEQFKTLKTRIKSAASDDSAPQVIGVTSPFIGDGKSLVGSNLALCYSQDLGRRVILIDCDLRKPSVHEYFELSARPGVSDFLHESLDAYCYIRRYQNLYLMTAGKDVDNPVELLSLERMPELLAQLRRDFDTIVMDAPPLEPISDVQILSKQCDGLLMVVRSGRTPYGSAERAIRHVDQKKILGVVLNDVPPMMFNTYYNYSYYQYGKQGAYPYAVRQAEESGIRNQESGRRG